jgi:hypothetical protein
VIQSTSNRSVVVTAMSTKPQHVLGVGLRVGEGESRAPRNAVEEPPTDVQLRAEPFGVVDEMGGRVLCQVVPRCSHVWSRSAAATLVEADDPEPRGVELGAIATDRQQAGRGHRRLVERGRHVNDAELEDAQLRASRSLTNRFKLVCCSAASMAN